MIAAISEQMNISGNNGNQTDDNSESSCEARITDQNEVVEELSEGLLASPD